MHFPIFGSYLYTLQTNKNKLHIFFNFGPLRGGGGQGKGEREKEKETIIVNKLKDVLFTWKTITI